MDVLSILGFILAVGLVMFGMTFDQESMRIVYHNLKAFLDIPSMAHYHWRYSWGYDDFIPGRGL